MEETEEGSHINTFITGRFNVKTTIQLLNAVETIRTQLTESLAKNVLGDLFDNIDGKEKVGVIDG